MTIFQIAKVEGNSTGYIATQIYLSMHLPIANIAVEHILVTLFQYNYVLVTIMTLWFLTRHRNMNTNVEQYMYIHTIYT